MSLWAYLTCDHCASTVYDANITHNLGRMADAAGFYRALWRPEEIGITRASELAVFLRAGLAAMLQEPARFRALDAPNGWGTYDQFVPWVDKLLRACEANPHARYAASR